MKKYNILLVALLFISRLCFGQNTDSTKIDIFMTKAQLKEINLDIDFIPSFVETPGRYIFLSSAKELYLLGKEGILPVISVSQQPVHSFTITPAGDLYAILDKKLYRRDSINNFQEIIDLPNDRMRLSAGKKSLYLYDGEIVTETNKHAIYELFPDNNYRKIIETPTPINAVLEVEEYVLFSSGNKLYGMDIANKVYQEITYLQNQNEKIISVTMDNSNQSLYFSSENAIFRMKEGKVDCVNDQFGGLLQYDGIGLVIFNPAESFIVRMRNNALFPATSQNVRLPQQPAPVPPIAKPKSSTSSTSPSSSSSSSTKQTITYDAPVLLISTSGERYEAQAGYYFEGTLKDGKVEQGTLYDSTGKAVKTFFKKK
ncbi:MAG: hypothetical protein LBS55_00080 [Prevotellaceae bacterium]|jgi:hypothetical protein|nr:hypothetical protein [Prevotellaceae bacterium]